ncbi:AAA family ATPase [Desulfovibrio sp. JC010]|uniref:AAA family ATPase n=1 Tax=Desulfovibrio sp. JC010 TaxID=2593641 RepID=UPI0013D64B03|nr:ATP-binding protein [Desulfovibrio sp. JC010]NDV27811.1 ATP-binding protein [Desulfovibrio sp. JC010]
MLRVVLTGSECTGKSTLAAALAKHYKVDPVPEYLREYFKMKDGNLTIDDVIPIAQGQLQLEAEAATRGAELIICDTDIISSIVYAKHYFNEYPGWLEQKLKYLGPSIYLLCDIDIEWKADGQRDMPGEREYMQQLFIKELKQRNIPFHNINGPLQRRIENSRQIIDATTKQSQHRHYVT